MQGVTPLTATLLTTLTQNGCESGYTINSKPTCTFSASNKTEKLFQEMVSILSYTATLKRSTGNIDRIRNKEITYKSKLTKP